MPSAPSHSRFRDAGQTRACPEPVRSANQETFTLRRFPLQPKTPMKTSKLTRAFATLTAGSLATGCPEADSATEVPPAGSIPASAVAGEHACGSHAEGACGSAAPASATVPSSRFLDVEPGSFAEVNVSMTERPTMTMTFSGGQSALSCDVRSHEKTGGARVHDQGDGGSRTVGFAASEDGVFSGTRGCRPPTGESP